MLPPITVIVITFNRHWEIRQTLNALMRSLSYSGELRYLIADDSTGDDYLADLAKEFPGIAVSSTPENLGWGGNANFHIGMIDTEIYLLVEDDYILTRKLDLNPGVATLLLNNSVGMVRYSGVAGHINMNFVLKEQDVASLVPTFEQGLMYVPRYQYLEILPVGEGFGAFTYSNRPHLTHKQRWHGAHGYYLEGYRLGDTELEYTMRVREHMQANKDAPRIIVPIDWLTNNWHDIGTSYQLTPHDKGRRLEDANT